MATKKLHLEKTETIEQIPAACSNEVKAVEFIERNRWGANPCCVHCGSVKVYQMKDAKTGERNKRFLWRCHDCKQQYTVRVGTVYEDSRLPLRHWCYAFWRAATSKKGVSALEIQRHCQISYKSALFLLHRIRFAMTPDANNLEKLSGTVECDETYVGGKPRYKGQSKRGRGTNKTPVFAMVERNGCVRTKPVADVTGKTLKDAIRQHVDAQAKIITDENPAYKGIGINFAGGHESVKHSAKEYVRGDVHTNTIEGFFSILKRGLIGVYHNVSKEHLHRYLGEFEYRYNHRRMNDGERLADVIRQSEGKRLMYKTPVAAGQKL